jgi:heat shock protein HslJ
MSPRLAVSFCAVVVTLAGLGVGAGRVASQATPEAEVTTALAPVVWQLIAIERAGEATVVPDDPSLYTVQFLEDGSLLVRADCNNGQGSFTVAGYALTLPPFRITLVACGPTSLDGVFVTALNDVVAFAYARDTLVLTLGDGGGALVFAPALTGVFWTLQSLQGGPASLSPDDPTAYTIAFGDDGRVAVRADCNRGIGAYTVDETQITIGPLALTRAACPPASLSDRFVQALESATAFSFVEGQLQLVLRDGAGTLVFAATSGESGPATPAAG